MIPLRMFVQVKKAKKCVCVHPCVCVWFFGHQPCQSAPCSATALHTSVYLLLLRTGKTDKSTSLPVSRALLQSLSLSPSHAWNTNAQTVSRHFQSRSSGISFSPLTENIVLSESLTPLLVDFDVLLALQIQSVFCKIRGQISVLWEFLAWSGGLVWIFRWKWSELFTE